MSEEQQTDLTSQPDENLEEVEQDVTAESDVDESNDQTEADDESEEIEFNSKAYKLPREIASAVKDMQKDYTTKTQAVAEQRKEFEAIAQFHEENLKEVAKVEALNSSLAEFEQLDWNALSEQDPALFQRLVAQQKTLEQQRNTLAQQLSGKFEKSRLEKQLAEAKFIEQSESEIKRNIKDWSPELDKNLQNFAVERYGFPKEHIGEYKRDAKMARLLHDAYIGQQIIKKQTSKPVIVKDAKPVTNISSKTSSNHGDLSKPEDYIKWRQKQRGR